MPRNLRLRRRRVYERYLDETANCLKVYRNLTASAWSMDRHA